VGKLARAKSAAPWRASVAERAPLRLPSFIGIGPARTGTTWLDAVLRNVAGLPAIKETKFFTQFYDRGIEWYSDFFRACPEGFTLGEVCPYFGNVDASERIHRHLPECKIFCTLRDPVERLYSFYRIDAKRGVTRKSFEGWMSTTRYAAPYTPALRRWQDRFGNRLLVTFYQDLSDNPQQYLDQLCNFIGLQRVDLATAKIREGARNSAERSSRHPRLAGAFHQLRIHLNRGGAQAFLNLINRTGFNRYIFGNGTLFEGMRPEMDASLRERYLTDIETLEQMLGRDLSAWKQPRALAPPDHRISSAGSDRNPDAGAQSAATRDGAR